MAAIPSPDQLGEAPERAALVVLDTALAVARAALIAENPDIALLGDPHQGRDPPRTRVLAGRLVMRADKLRDLVDRYLVVLDRLRRERVDQDCPF
jgi:hypothetical protein